MASASNETLNLWFLAGCLLCGACIPFFALRIWPQMWRGEYEYARLDPPPSAWLWGPITWHAFVRTWFFGTWFTVVILLSFPLALPGTLPFRLAVALALLFVVYWALWLSIALVNRPHFCIPPYLRGEPGLLREALTASRQRSAAETAKVWRQFIGWLLVTGGCAAGIVGGLALGGAGAVTILVLLGGGGGALLAGRLGLWP